MKRNAYLMNLFDENINNCREAMKVNQDSMACYARGCAQGIATSMYISDMISQQVFDVMCERIRRSITMEVDLI